MAELDGALSERDLDVIEERCNRATLGPWRSFVEGRDHHSGSNFIQTGGADIELSGATESDQDFIAHSRQDVPTLVRELRRLLARLRDASSP